jgi:hypothetical protein
MRQCSTPGGKVLGITHLYGAWLVSNLLLLLFCSPSMSRSSPAGGPLKLGKQECSYRVAHNTSKLEVEGGLRIWQNIASVCGQEVNGRFMRHTVNGEISQNPMVKEEKVQSHSPAITAGKSLASKETGATPREGPHEGNGPCKWVCGKDRLRSSKSARSPQASPG